LCRSSGVVEDPLTWRWHRDRAGQPVSQGPGPLPRCRMLIHPPSGLKPPRLTAPGIDASPALSAIAVSQRIYGESGVESMTAGYNWGSAAWPDSSAVSVGETAPSLGATGWSPLVTSSIRTGVMPPAGLLTETVRNLPTDPTTRRPSRPALHERQLH